MQPKARLLAVALASLVLGFLINEFKSDNASYGFPSHENSSADLSYDKNTDTLSGAVSTSAALAIHKHQPVPMTQPTVTFRMVVTPVPIEPDPQDQAFVQESEAQLANEIGDSADLNFVASLTQEGQNVDIGEGFNNLVPGTLTRLTWRAGESLYGSSIPTPVLVAEGVEAGSTLCLTGAVHGDELNGIETVRRLMYSLNPEKLTGRVVGVPIVNLQGFERHSRYLPDRRDLNRFFPGNPTGSSASRIAHSFFQQVIGRCSALVDLHTGSFHRTNLPQLRANLQDESVLSLTEGFGGLVILHSTGGAGTLRASAVAAGIPAVTIEAGEPLRVDNKAVDHSVKAIFSLLDDLGMYKRRSFWGNPEPTYYGSLWVRADKGGMLLGNVKLGKRVREGDVLGSVTDPITNSRQEILAPQSGRVIGMALNQFVMPGYATFHLGVEAPSADQLPESGPDPVAGHAVALADGVIDDRDDSDE